MIFANLPLAQALYRMQRLYLPRVDRILWRHIDVLKVANMPSFSSRDRTPPPSAHRFPAESVQRAAQRTGDLRVTGRPETRHPDTMCTVLTLYAGGGGQRAVK